MDDLKLLERINSIDRTLILRRSVIEAGTGDRRLRAELERGTIVRVMHGCYMSSSTWNKLFESDRLLARSLCTARLQPGRPPIFSHLSAAAIWGLPLYGLKRSAPEHVHLLMRPETLGKSSNRVRRHAEPYDESEVTEVAGLRVTTLTRTIRDLARRASPELAIGCADAGLRALLGGSHAELPESFEEWRETQFETLAAQSGARGVQRAKRIVALADPRADSVAESVSRLQLWRLGIPFGIQVRTEGLNGATYWMDFEFLGQQCFGEMDGAIKYLDPGYRNGRTLEEVLLEEKHREDEVRGVHRKRTVRWGWNAIGTPRALGARLSGFGLEVPRLAEWSRHALA